MTSVLCGAAFGAALTSAGLHQPSIIIAQLKFENWHMLQVFLGATASSALAYTVSTNAGFLTLRPRSSSSIGLFSQYDGNIIGGLLLGAGMGLSGACPGTLLAQIAANVEGGFYALNGAILGGLAWTGFASQLARRSRDTAKARPVTVAAHEQFRVSRKTALLLFLSVCFSVIAITTAYTPRYPGTRVLGMTGGLLIGVSQLLSLLVRRSMIGVSMAYDEFGALLWWIFKGGGEGSHRPQSHQNIMFAVGILAGAWGVLQAFPSLATFPIVEISPRLATTGGALMTLGSRVAGGCTSGHGISGMSLLSVSSMITIMSAFAMGAIVTPFAH